MPYLTLLNLRTRLWEFVKMPLPYRDPLATTRPPPLILEAHDPFVDKADANNDLSFHPCLIRLTIRQREVLYLFLSDMSTKEIAWCLQIATARVSAHKSEVMRKLHLTSDLQMILFGLRMDLVAFPPPSLPTLTPP